MNEVQNNRKENKTIKVIIALLVIIIIGLICFIAYDKMFKDDSSIKNNDNNTNTENKVVELDINSELVNNLVYIHRGINETIDNQIPISLFENFSVNSLTRDEMMMYSLINAEDNIRTECDIMEENNNCKIITYQSGDKVKASNSLSAIEMKNSFEKIFGKEVNYSDGTFNEGICHYPTTFDSETKNYYGSDGCGGGFGITVGSIISKVEQKNDEIYVYVNPFKIWNGYMLNELETTSKLGYDSDKIYLFDFKTDNAENNKNYLQIISSDNFNSVKPVVRELVNNGKMSTYKFTFKKQSDGKYYIYSGEWQ
ncbi:MAG: hypothetical protein NC181_01750 [Clostridium sp.]|nr:hypothetical protein [Clostridium sp.]MCM1444281.1 hypothetical protein [Candidatus Amulumruptor caecigallinarius]